MQRMVLEPGVRPTMVARPEEVFMRSNVEDGVPSSRASDPSVAQTNISAPATTGEQFRNDLPDSAKGLPWVAADALLQLKLALSDIPRLRPVSDETVSAASSALPKVSEVVSGPSEAQIVGRSRSLSVSTFLPPVVRYNTVSASSSDYTQRALSGILDACKRLEGQLGNVDQSDRNEDYTEDLQWAHVMYCLQEPKLVSQLQRRADAAIWEKEYSYRLNSLLNAELRKRGVPVEVAEEDFIPFLDQVQRGRSMLDSSLYTERAASTLAPMLEAAVARAACLSDIASQSSPEATNTLESLGRCVTGLSAQVKEDASLLRRNLAAMRRRLDALQGSKALPQQ
ncbi:hypothetical protein ABL78_4753 [Leptomonas seymouri]|uniref:Uncharacterized protein n=1 Tax=Leptomonas seymouri TaxID=5684 RepID=A0A0N1IKF7_LEPSE|nr:hypothetical protein ABL78_4753 [Leptomonas seymouri]|eukprot:KPI86200.1 hypothetical protein ABL78_4753 [Leptomonas seymouri]